ncbi:hypothetical protein GCM10028809_59640 [Spirosoma gilvum]
MVPDADRDYIAEKHKHTVDTLRQVFQEGSQFTWIQQKFNSEYPTDLSVGQIMRDLFFSYL